MGGVKFNGGCKRRFLTGEKLYQKLYTRKVRSQYLKMLRDEKIRRKKRRPIKNSESGIGNGGAAEEERLKVPEFVKKHPIFAKSREEYEKKQAEKRINYEKRQERLKGLERKKAEKIKRNRLYGIKTPRGQPVLRPIIKLLIEKIEKKIKSNLL